MDPRWTISLGASAEILADQYGITRESQDESALRSHTLAARAWEQGLLDDEIVQYPAFEIARDESIRDDTSLERLAKLGPVFREDGTVTAGNSSPLNDAAAALLIASEPAAEVIGCEPPARIVSRGVHAVDPDVLGIAPVRAAEIALQRAGISWAEIVAVELNEAFCGPDARVSELLDRVGPRAAQRPRRRDRLRPPHRGVGRADPRRPCPRA
jgi:acetyl-CoA acetyltransferase